VSGVLWAEWVKLRSLRSTWVTVLLAVATTLSLAVLTPRSVVREWPAMSASDRAAFDPFQTAFDGAVWAEFAFGALGVLAMTGEYATGSIRTTFTAVPRRLAVLVAKVVVVGGVVLLLGEALALTSFLVGQRVLAERHLDAALSDPGVLRAILAGGAYLLVITLVGMGLGAVLRHGAAGVTALFALVYLAYGVARAMQSWSYLPDRWLLVNAGTSVTALHRPVGPESPSVTAAAFELAAYAAVALAAAALRLRADV
jgi:ABC-2 type transport system permease protein